MKPSGEHTRPPACGVRRLAEHGFPARRRKLHARARALPGPTEIVSVSAVFRRRPPRVALAAPQRPSEESSSSLKFATSEAVERGSRPFYKMNSTAIYRESSTETDLGDHDLAWLGWLRDALPAAVIFRPYSAGPANRKPADENNVPRATPRDAQAINVSGRISLRLKDFVGRRFRNSRGTRSNFISTFKQL
jgi:hypothetical protein